jgi:hypothetical protein
MVKDLTEEDQMPKWLERQLMRKAKSKGLKGDKAKAYAYSTMSKLGLLHKKGKK